MYKYTHTYIYIYVYICICNHSCIQATDLSHTVVHRDWETKATVWAEESLANHHRKHGHCLGSISEPSSRLLGIRV